MTVMPINKLGAVRFADSATDRRQDSQYLLYKEDDVYISNDWF